MRSSLSCTSPSRYISSVLTYGGCSIKCRNLDNMRGFLSLIVEQKPIVFTADGRYQTSDIFVPGGRNITVGIAHAIGLIFCRHQLGISELSRQPTPSPRYRGSQCRNTPTNRSSPCPPSPRSPACPYTGTPVRPEAHAISLSIPDVPPTTALALVVRNTHRSPIRHTG